MYSRLQKLIAWTLIAQVLLVGGLGTGLHGLFGCEHGPKACCTARCCSSSSDVTSRSSCADCVFCSRDSHKRPASSASIAGSEYRIALLTTAGCDGCAVCDVLAQYHTVTPFELDVLAIELASGDAVLQRKNAAIAAAIRLAPSRGPPAV